jgi:TolA-binding protein
MVALRRSILVLFLSLAAGLRLGAATTTEKGLFDSATGKLKDGFFQPAEQEFAGFVQQYTNSPLVPEALRLQALARLKQTNYSGAIELLSAHLKEAGPRADAYLFLIAKATALQGEFSKAAEAFAQLVKEFPTSTNRLEAVIEGAAARAKLGEWPKVIELLQEPNGSFQTAARAGANNDLVARGYLMLGEAQLAKRNYQDTQTTLAALTKLSMAPELAWQRQYLISRLRAGESKTTEALESATNLMALAVTTARRDLQAESIAFHAGLLEQVGRIDEAVKVYENNLADGYPVERQQQALLKITELCLAQNKVAQAARMLDKFSTTFSDSPAADLGLLTLGELRLRQYVTGATPETNRVDNAATNAPAATNFLQSAMAALNTLLKKFPKSARVGKAQLDLGWCLWLSGQWPECQAAFQKAVEQLKAPSELAIAHFKLGDAQDKQGEFAGALTNYSAVANQFAELPEVKTNLLEAALYQSVRSALANTNLPAATNAMAKLIAWYPVGYHTDGAVLLTGQVISRRGNPAEARRIFSEFLKQDPDARLGPEVELEIARTCEEENKWEEALARYESWLSRFTNSPARPRAEYSRAWANFQAGHETNALSQFTNFVTHYPTNEYAPFAQRWVADYYFGKGALVDAENNYQWIYQSTNWPASDLTYQARMMAGRSAIQRRGWNDALEYFKGVYKDPNCTNELRFRALYAIGDTFMSWGSETNKAANYADALNAFDEICRLYPSNKLAVLALGAKANCRLQWAQSSTNSFADLNAASNAFQEVIDSPLADFTAWSIAKFGQAVVFEKQAEQKSSKEQAVLFQAALTNCIDIFYNEKKKDDLFWVQKAGLEAAGLAERLQLWPQALNVYRDLQRCLPPLRDRLELKIRQAEEKERLAKPKS